MVEALFIATLIYLGQDTDPWSRADYAREGVYMTLNVADWAQTRDAAKYPIRDGLKYREMNPFIGHYPTVNDVNTYYAFEMLWHPLLANALPSKPRRYFQSATIVGKTALIVHNQQIGLRIKF